MCGSANGCRNGLGRPEGFLNNAEAGGRGEFLAKSGEMGQRMSAFDWRRTPLGPIESWPQSLKTAVSLILRSRHPMWIGWGPEITFLYNDAYLHVLGPAKHPQALGRPAARVWAEAWDVCGPLADKVFGNGEASFVDEVRLFMNRGDFLEETFYSFSYSPISDESGRVAGLFCPSTDVTHKVINARRLRTLSDLAANALAEQTVAAACAAAMRTLGENPADIPFALFYRPDAGGGFARLVQTVGYSGPGPAEARPVNLAAVSESDPFPIADVFQHLRAQTIPLHRIRGLAAGVAQQPVRQAVVLPVSSRADPVPYGVLVMGASPGRPLDEDHRTFFQLVANQLAAAIQNGCTLEEQKKRADLLAEADRAKTVFFSNVSHEFRTPLTLMLGPLEALLARPNRLQPEDQAQLAIAHRNSLRLLKLVSSLLDFSRIEAGRMKAAFIATDLAALTTDLSANFRSALEGGGLALLVDCPPLAEPVYVDQEMWEKIVLNILSNAFKFTLKGGVAVRLRAEGEQAVLSVSDTGTGIPEAELPRIFERFHRVEGARGRTYEGTGIGLALIEELVKLHGGSISAASKLGEGSTFTVRLPLGAAHLPKEHLAGAAFDSLSLGVQAFREEAAAWLAPPPPPATGASQHGENSSKPFIVFADDNADMREHVKRALEADYEIGLARDGRAALALIQERQPALVLTDVMMPVLDGFGLLRAIRAEPKTQTLPVIFLSARAGEEMRIEGLEAGADDYLVKPFTANELRARVGTHVQMALARRRASEREAALRAEAEAARDSVIDVLEKITDGFMALDRAWKLTYANAEAEKLHGMRREDMRDKSVWDLFPGAAGTALETELRRAREEQAPVELEYYFTAWQRWFHIKAYAAAEGGLSLFYKDISIRKIAEQDRAAMLRRERDALGEAQTLNELARTLSAELDLPKLVQNVTDAATKETGAQLGAFFYNIASPQGDSCVLYALSGASREAFEKLGAPRITPVFAATFHGRAMFRSDDILQDPRYGRLAPHHGLPLGHLPVRSYLAAPVISRSGEVLGGLFFGHADTAVFSERSERLAMGIARHAAIAIDNARLFSQAERELSQRKEAEDLLRESEQRFRELAEVGPQFVFVSGTDGSVEYVNQQWLNYAGIERPRAHGGNPFEQAVHPADKVELMRGWRKSLETGAPFAGEARLHRHDGTFRWFVMRAVPLHDANGAITKWIGAATEIDDQKRVEDELRRANLDLEQFAYSASHDLREPLRTIQIYSELLATRYAAKLEGQALEFLGYLRQGAGRMENLVSDLLAYTQVTRFELPGGTIDANEALRETLANLGKAIAESGARVTADALPHVLIHRSHLRQLLQNLVGNAIKYRSKERIPAVHVSAQRDNGSWVFSVTDNGIGIPFEYRERIFGLFKRLHTSEEYSGTGIGLAICQRILERYHGSIRVESVPGQGSTFIFTLPA